LAYSNNPPGLGNKLSSYGTLLAAIHKAETEENRLCGTIELVLK
jgi:hypothetical protein